jgi:DNA-binding response OmpR family regulator
MEIHRRGVKHYAAQVRTAAGQGVEPHPDGKRWPIRVLILEDDPDTEVALSQILTLEDGLAVDIVHDVATCLERVRTSTAVSDRGQAHPYDVLLLDVVLKRGHLGTEVVAATTVDPLLTLPPVVVCTALSSVYLAARVPWLAAHNLRVLLKPFDLDVLPAELRAAATGVKVRARAVR